MTYGPSFSCDGFGGGGYFNITILESYLQTHQSQIVYSQTIVDQNITLSSIAYHVTRPTDVTVVLAHLGSSPAREYYHKTTVVNQILRYPLIGYTESQGTIFTLPNISIGLVAAGAASLAILSVRQLRLPSRRSGGSQGATVMKCPQCGAENLFFAEKCGHCSRPLHETPPMVEARSLTNYP